MIIIVIFPSFKNYEERFKYYCEMSKCDLIEELYIFTRHVPEVKNCPQSKKLKINEIKNKFKFYLTLNWKIKKVICNKRNIIIVNHFLNNVFISKAKKRKKNIKVITKFYFPNFIIFFIKKKIRFEIKQKILLFKRSMLDLLSIYLSDIIIGNSYDIEYAVKKVQEKIGLNRKIITFPTPVDIDLFSPLNEKKFITEGMAKILFVGNLLKRKGIYDLLDVAKMLVDRKIKYKMIIIGKYLDKKTEERVNALIKVNKLDAYLEFKGKIKQKGLVSFYRNSDIFIFPSYHEGSPRVVKEAMACGLPVIAYRIYGNEVIDKRKDIIRFASLGNKKELFGRILELINNPNKLEYYSKKGIEHIKNNFSIRKLVEMEMQMYKELLK